MPPDLNSLPPSRSPSNSSSPLQSRPSMAASVEAFPQSPSLSSLQAAAAINAGMHRSPGSTSPRFERRRSSLMTNLQLNDPAVPAPGEMLHAHPYPYPHPHSHSHSQAHSHRSPSLSTRTRSPPRLPDPQHHRAPSLGQIHQELENEQEAQVNRLLQMIRVQQDQITALQPTSPTSSEPSSHHAPPVPSNPDTESRSRTTSSAAIPINLMQAAQPRSPSQRPMSLSRQSSRAASGIRSSSQSPALRPVSTSDSHRDEWLYGAGGGSRDEHAFYQAETQMLTRENQMLKQRIQRQLGEMNASTPSGLGLVSTSPVAVSPLASPPVAADNQFETSHEVS
ncbi:hypothetical protein MBLNU459_g8023t1 [Dothideomycetes sp. NU459]